VTIAIIVKIVKIMAFGIISGVSCFAFGLFLGRELGLLQCLIELMERREDEEYYR